MFSNKLFNLEIDKIPNHILLAFYIAPKFTNTISENL